MKSWLENFQAVFIFFYMLTKNISEAVILSGDYYLLLGWKGNAEKRS